MNKLDDWEDVDDDGTPSGEEEEDEWEREDDWTP